MVFQPADPDPRVQQNILGGSMWRQGAHGSREHRAEAAQGRQEAEKRKWKRCSPTGDLTSSK